MPPDEHPAPDSRAHPAGRITCSTALRVVRSAPVSTRCGTTATPLPDPKPRRLVPDARIFADLLRSAKMQAGSPKAGRHGVPHLIAGRATRERVGAVQTNAHAHRSGCLHLPKS